MLARKTNFKTAITGTLVSTILSMSVTEVVQAQNYGAGVRPGPRYESRFQIITAASDSSSSGENAGRYIPGFSNYNIYDYDFAPPSLVDKTRRSGTLTVIPFTVVNDPNAFNSTLVGRSFRDNSYTIPRGATIYEYSLLINDIQGIIDQLDSLDTPFPFEAPPIPPTLRRGVVKYYVPSEAIYSRSGVGSFNIRLGDGRDALLNSLTGLNTIFAAARPITRAVPFPSNLLQPNGELATVNFDPNPIPESDSSIGLIVLGLVGGFSIAMKKRC